MEGSAESVRRDHDGVVIAHHHDDHANGDTDDHHDDHAFSKYGVDTDHKHQTVNLYDHDAVMIMVSVLMLDICKQNLALKIIEFIYRCSGEIVIMLVSLPS